MSVNTLNNDTYVNGNLACKTFTPPSGCIRATSIEPNAGIEASKLMHRYRAGHAQLHGTNATVERRVVHVVRGATATIVSLRVGASVAAAGDSTVTIDLRKNGTTVLTGTIEINSGDTAFSLLSPGGYTSNSLVAGDVLEIVQTISAGSGTLPQGVFSVVDVDEAAN